MEKIELKSLEIFKMFDEILKKYNQDLKDLDEKFVCRSVEVAELVDVPTTKMNRSIHTLILNVGFRVDELSNIKLHEIKDQARKDMNKSHWDGRSSENSETMEELLRGIMGIYGQVQAKCNDMYQEVSENIGGK